MLRKMSKSPYFRMFLLLAFAVAFAILAERFSRPEKYTSSYATIEAPTAGPSPKGSGPVMKAGTGLASSLLPREVASQEEFGEFAPEDILAGQNFLEPRQQIGIPETTGGALRNANQNIRSEPPNPKEAFTWNNSTIAPDSMQRPLV